MADDRQPWRRLSSEIDRLQEAADAAEAEFAEKVVVAHAESSVSSLRSEDLMRIQDCAWRRVAAARDRLTRACGGGDAEAIRHARQGLDERQSEAEAISDACITEMQTNTRASLERLGAILDQHAVSDAAGRRVTEAIAAHRRK